MTRVDAAVEAAYLAAMHRSYDHQVVLRATVLECTVLYNAVHLMLRHPQSPAMHAPMLTRLLQECRRALDGVDPAFGAMMDARRADAERQ